MDSENIETNDFQEMLESILEPIDLDELANLLPQEINEQFPEFYDLGLPQESKNPLDQPNTNNSFLFRNDQNIPSTNPTSEETKAPLKQEPNIDTTINPHQNLNFGKRSSPSDTNKEDMQQLLEMISWNPVEHHIQKPLLNSHSKDENENPLNKHKTSEKKRRDDMNEMIEKLRTILPINKDTKLTKLNILNETADYIERLQQLSLQLIKEKKELEKLQQKTEEPPPKKAKISIGKENLGQYGTKAVFFSVLFMVVIFVPQVKPTTSFEVIHFGWLGQYLWQGIVYFASITFLFALSCFFTRTVSQSSVRFEESIQQIQLAEKSILSGDLKTQIELKFRECLIKLNRNPSSSYFLLFLSVQYQLIRHLLHRLAVGLFIEKTIMHIRGVEEEYAKTLVVASKNFLRYYSGEPRLEWFYVAISAINWAQLFNLQIELEELEAACLFRISGNLRFYLRLFTAYLQWDVTRNHLSCRINNDIVHKIDLLIAETVKLIVEGKLDEAKMIIDQCQSFDNLIDKIETRNILLFRILAIQGVISHLKKNWKEGTQFFYLASQVSKGYALGECYTILGLLTFMLKQKNLNKAETIIKFYEKNFSKKMEGTSEDIIFKILRAQYLFLRGNFIESANSCQDIHNDPRDSRMYDVPFFSVEFFETRTQVLLALWEESQKKNSPIYSRQEEFRTQSKESIRRLHKIAHTYPLMLPRAFLCEAKFHLLEKNFDFAKKSFVNALESAKKSKFSKDEEKIAQEELNKLK